MDNASAMASAGCGSLYFLEFLLQQLQSALWSLQQIAKYCYNLLV